MNFVVKEDDTQTFPPGTVHCVYSTLALIRDAGWTTRQFVLEMKDADDEGIGTMVSATHHSPAVVGEEVLIIGTVKNIYRHEIICTYEVTVARRLIATGETGQKILKREKFEKLFTSLKKN